jgi:hypothetical protein
MCGSILPAKIKLAGKHNVSVRFHHSGLDSAWRLKPAMAAGRAALLAYNRADGNDRYIILLG